MKFYDLEALSRKSGMDNKYEITARIAARARWLGEHKTVLEHDVNERYLSIALKEADLGQGIPAPGDPLRLSQNETE
ncbi:MAG: DNA-directed RNA polymerase subunit omega [Fretibacterium sp.]|nr:DNA-directed RNA polymerase subunit omega [Fretibacterium sp.]